MVLRPVELDSSADPRTAEADKSRFDHMVVIDKVIMIRLVVRSLDPASELRKDHDFQILIFQPDGMVRLIFFLIINLFDRRVRIDPAGASLINTALQKHRVFICCSDPISRNDHIFFPDLHSTHNSDLLLFSILVPILYGIFSSENSSP